MRYLYGCDELRDAIRLDYDFDDNFSSDSVFHVPSRPLCLRVSFSSCDIVPVVARATGSSRLYFYRWSEIGDRGNRVIIMLSLLQYNNRSCLHHSTTSRNE